MFDREELNKVKVFFKLNKQNNNEEWNAAHKIDSMWSERQWATLEQKT
jgi:hypothetical protein